jgi:hypothetical protein
MRGSLKQVSMLLLCISITACGWTGGDSCQRDIMMQEMQERQRSQQVSKPKEDEARPHVNPATMND